MFANEKNEHYPVAQQTSTRVILGFESEPADIVPPRTSGKEIDGRVAELPVRKSQN
jgi:hypothetical protein